MNDEAVERIKRLAQEGIRIFEEILRECEAVEKDETSAIEIPSFRTKTDALKFVLSKYPEGTHLSNIIAELETLNISIDKLVASGILRRQAANGNYFVTLGRNRFKLKEEEFFKVKKHD